MTKCVSVENSKSFICCLTTQHYTCLFKSKTYSSDQPLVLDKLVWTDATILIFVNCFLWVGFMIEKHGNVKKIWKTIDLHLVVGHWCTVYRKGCKTWTMLHLAPCVCMHSSFNSTFGNIKRIVYSCLAIKYFLHIVLLLIV